MGQNKRRGVVTVTASHARRELFAFLFRERQILKACYVIQLLLQLSNRLVLSSARVSSGRSPGVSFAPVPPQRLLSTSVKAGFDKATALAQLRDSSGWTIGPENGFISKSLQFASFTDAWSFMSALALFSARHNHVSLLGYRLKL